MENRQIFQEVKNSCKSTSRTFLDKVIQWLFLHDFSHNKELQGITGEERVKRVQEILLKKQNDRTENLEILKNQNDYEKTQKIKNSVDWDFDLE